MFQETARRETFSPFFSFSLLLLCQVRKNSTKINFLGLEIAGWGWGLPREEVVAKKFVPSLKSLFPWVSKEGTWDVLGILLGCSGPLPSRQPLLRTPSKNPSQNPSSLQNPLHDTFSEPFLELSRRESREPSKNAS